MNVRIKFREPQESWLYTKSSRFSQNLIHLQVWRNWQTRMVQVHVRATSCRFKSCYLHHVEAKFTLLRLFYAKSRPHVSLLLLFHKKSRSAYLFGCKRPHDGSLSLPTFCEFLTRYEHLHQKHNYRFSGGYAFLFSRI